MERLRADEARLALRVVGVLLGRDRDGLLVFFVGVVFFGAAAFFYQFAEVFVPARGVPVLLLAGWTTVARLAAAALLRFVRERGGAGGTICKDHFFDNKASSGGSAREE
jgi:hypothetical protein